MKKVFLVYSLKYLEHIFALSSQNYTSSPFLNRKIKIEVIVTKNFDVSIAILRICVAYVIAVIQLGMFVCCHLNDSTVLRVPIPTNKQQKADLSKTHQPARDLINLSKSQRKNFFNAA